AGWYMAHRFAAERDRANNQRDLRVRYLVDAYRQLETACSRDDIMPYKEGVECAIADVQLFGTPRQVELAKAIMRDIETGSRTTDPRTLLSDLRTDLRRELNLVALTNQITHFRVHGNTPKPAKPAA